MTTHIKLKLSNVVTLCRNYKKFEALFLVNKEDRKLLKSMAEELNGVKFYKNEGLIEFPVSGSRIYIMRLSDPAAVRGLRLDYIHMDQDIEEEWEAIIAPALAFTPPKERA